MNERLRKMAEQCGIYWDEQYGITKPPSSHDLEAFARAIAADLERAILERANPYEHCPASAHAFDMTVASDARIIRARYLTG